MRHHGRRRAGDRALSLAPVRAWRRPDTRRLPAATGIPVSVSAVTDGQPDAYNAPTDIRSYEDLTAALKARRHALGLSEVELDAIAGFQDGYVGKLEVGYREGGRGVGAVSLPTWLEALGVCLRIVPR